MGFEPPRMLPGDAAKSGSTIYMQMPYGDQPTDAGPQAAKLARSTQSSVNAVRKANAG